MRRDAEGKNQPHRRIAVWCAVEARESGKNLNILEIEILFCASHHLPEGKALSGVSIYLVS